MTKSSKIFLCLLIAVLPSAYCHFVEEYEGIIDSDEDRNTDDLLTGLHLADSQRKAKEYEGIVSDEDKSTDDLLTGLHLGDSQGKAKEYEGIVSDEDKSTDDLLTGLHLADNQRKANEYESIVSDEDKSTDDLLTGLHLVDCQRNAKESESVISDEDKNTDDLLTGLHLADSQRKAKGYESIVSDEDKSTNDILTGIHMTGRQGNGFVCPVIYGRYANPDDCSEFYLCRFAVPHLMKCAQGKLYDEQKEECRDKELVKCKGRKHKEESGSREEDTSLEETGDEPFTCPYIWGTFAHPKHCYQFYICYYKTPTLYTCPFNQLYDVKERRCKDRQLVSCDSRLDRDQINPTKKPDGKGTTSSDRITTIKDNGVYTCTFAYGRAAYPGDCSKFYACHFYQPTVHSCPRNLLYDEKMEECREAKRVKCGGRPRGQNDDYDGSIIEKKEEFRCPYTWGTFAHPQDCSRFIVCIYTVPTYYTCNKNDLFDPKYRKCVPASQVDCDGRNNPNDQKPKVTTPRPKPTSRPIKEENVFYCPFMYGRYPDSRDCSRFYACNFFLPTLHNCPANTLYDARKEECREAKQVKCGDRPRGNNDDFVEVKNKKKEIFHCPYIWGTFADPEDCSKYIICIYNVPTFFSCRKTELFDPKYRRCLPSEQVTCDGRINPDDEEVISEKKEIFHCPAPFGIHSLPDCSKYVICVFNVSSIYKCRNNQLFAPRYRRCLPADQVDCDGRINPYGDNRLTTTVRTTVTPNPQPTTIPTTISTKKETIPPTRSTARPTTIRPTTIATRPPTTTTRPTTTLPTTTKPPTTKIYTQSPLDRWTNPWIPMTTTQPNIPPPTDCRKDDVDCIMDKTKNVKKWFTCPERYGHFPHAGNAQLFIHCDNWQPFIKRCAEKTAFSPIFNVCVWSGIAPIIDV